MATSSVISWFRSENEQALIESMIVEVIKLYGYDIYYLPREAVRTNDLFGEDVLTRYPFALEIEAYIENVEGFGGMGEVFSKFGVEISDMVTFLVANKRWDEVKKGRSTLSEDGYTIVPESTVVDGPGAKDQLLDEEQTYDYSNQTRPNEGDLVYFPLVGKMFEIKFVEHEKYFYPLGKRMIFQLKCELWQGSSERIDTGITEIDAVETTTSLDAGLYPILDEENGVTLLGEDGFRLVSEDFRIEDIEPLANNENFQASISGIVDWSETNPFVTGRTY